VVHCAGGKCLIHRQDAPIPDYFLGKNPALSSGSVCPASIPALAHLLLREGQDPLTGSRAAMKLTRRSLLAGSAAGLAVLGAPAIIRAQSPRTIKMGALRLIHSITPHFYEKVTPPDLKFEVITFDSPTDGKNAVVTRSVDFGMFGIAAATLGAAAGEPVVVIAGACNRGMAVIAKKDAPIASVKDLKGRKVAIWPGSTQEVFIMERLRMEGMSVKDITAIRVPFGEMHAAMARGDVDAYVGAEPTPGLSISSGVGKLVEYPYGTSMGSLNMVTCTHEKMLQENPDLVRAFLRVHRKATEAANATPEAKVEMAQQKLGIKREALDIAGPNVELTWRMDQTLMTQARTYAQQMLEMKQIRALPDFNKFFGPALNDQIAGEKV
jgi:ABC-type nitrate/sulfonate/bicarbonate transport system substrate-binding protein